MKPTLTAELRRELHKLATDAHELGIIKRYTKGIEANKRFAAAATPLVIRALLDELEAKDRRIEEEIGRANREHHRGFMMACGHLKEHANAHYADAAEMEIEALRKRIAELEARTPTVKMPEPFKLAKSSSGLTYYYADEVDKALAAASINVEAE